MSRLDEGSVVATNMGIAEGNLDMIIQELTWRTEGKSSLWNDKQLLRMAEKALLHIANKEVELR